jgi:hypothetical protein
MKQRMVFAVAIGVLALAPAAFSQSTDTGTSTLSVAVGPEASFSSNTATTTFSGDTKFGAKTGSTNFSYKIRTSQSTGTGSVTVLVTAFGADGPALADLTYGCTVESPATGCGASGQTVSTSSGTNVASFGADAHSTDAGDAGSLTWTLVDRTSVKTGTYTSTATFTVSAA